MHTPFKKYTYIQEKTGSEIYINNMPLYIPAAAGAKPHFNERHCTKHLYIVKILRIRIKGFKYRRKKNLLSTNKLNTTFLVPM